MNKALATSLSAFIAPAARRGYAVFGLLSLLIVVAIMMFLFVGPMGSSPKAAPAAPGAAGTTGPGGQPPATTGGGYVRAAIKSKQLAQATAIQSNINQICIMMAIYRTNHDGKLPKELSELEAPEQIFNDQWGTPMRFTYGEAAQGSTITDITFHSAGKDELMNTPDDVIWKGKLPY